MIYYAKNTQEINGQTFSLYSMGEVDFISDIPEGTELITQQEYQQGVLEMVAERAAFRAALQAERDREDAEREAAANET